MALCFKRYVLFQWEGVGFVMCHSLHLDLEFFLEIFFFFSTPHSLWDLSSWTRDQTQALGGENTESQLLNCQGIPDLRVFKGRAANY